MRAVSALGRFRRRAESRMRGKLAVRRPLPGHETIGDDGSVIPLYDGTFEHETPYYGRYPGLAHETVRHTAGSTVVESRLVARVPFGQVYRPGDVLTVLEDPDNPQMVGAMFRVASIDDQSQATAQRLLCEDFQSGVAQ